jgi:hypothetical protein
MGPLAAFPLELRDSLGDRPGNMRQPRPLRESLVEEALIAAHFVGFMALALATMGQSVAVAGVTTLARYREARRSAPPSARTSCRK